MLGSQLERVVTGGGGVTIMRESGGDGHYAGTRCTSTIEEGCAEDATYGDRATIEDLGSDAAAVAGKVCAVAGVLTLEVTDAPIYVT